MHTMYGIRLYDAQEINSNTILIDQSTYGSAIWVYQYDGNNIDLTIENNHIENYTVYLREVILQQYIINLVIIIVEMF